MTSETRSPGPQESRSRLAAFRREDVEAAFREDRAGRLVNHAFVVDYQNRSRPARRLGPGFGRLDGSFLFGSRKENVERRATAGRAVDADGSAIGLHDAGDGSEAESAARELRVKNGSKILALVASSMPEPVSSISSQT